MRFTPWKCPQCDEPASGTIDAIPGLALLHFDADGTAAWQFETKVLWNGQTTVRDADDNVTLTCPEGHEWQAEMESDSDEVASVATKPDSERGDAHDQVN